MPATAPLSGGLFSLGAIGQAASIKAAISEEVVFNTSIVAATATPTAPALTLAGSATNHGNVVVQPVPDGANYLDLTAVVDALPGTRCKVRVFGEVVRLNNSILRAKNYSSSYFDWNVDSSLNEWVPLSTTDGSYNPELGDADGTVLTRGSDLVLKPKTFYVKGCKRVMVLISDAAATTISRGMAIGHWGL